MALVFDDLRFYRDYQYYERHFAWPGDSAPDGPLLYHCFWSGMLTQHHAMSLCSAQLTQSQPFEIWLWLPPSGVDQNQAFLESLNLPNLRVRPYLPEEEACGTVFQSCGACFTPPDLALASDWFRTLILLKYGGVYFDCDVFFLKDLRPLCGVEFFYPWSLQPYGNSAVARFRRDSANIQALAAHAARIRSCHPRYLYRYRDLDAILDGVHVFPTFVFDPVWISTDLHQTITPYCNHCDDFFELEVPVSLEQFFPASYAYHWHNQWTKPIRASSIAGQLFQQLQGRGCRRHGRP